MLYIDMQGIKFIMFHSFTMGFNTVSLSWFHLYLHKCHENITSLSYLSKIGKTKIELKKMHDK